MKRKTKSKAPITLTTPMCKVEVQKLVEYFRGEGLKAFGDKGDVDLLTPAETAIRAMRELATLRVASPERITRATTRIPFACWQFLEKGCVVPRWVLPYLTGQVSGAIDLQVENCATRRLEEGDWVVCFGEKCFEVYGPEQFGRDFTLLSYP